ncbi:MAG TPA: FAD-binding oxidoreductase [Methylomirabilota bacterium]|jgi:D-arginine dehydrogenase|nr:FAD-binding oxidoreductase [Methylomirabilota bacterium]
MERREADFLIVGGGIAGASAGAWLAREGRALILERESQPGYHTTGRSAALYTEHYGNAPVRALTRASGRFLKEPPAGFAEHPILSHRRMLFIARPDQMDRLDAAEEEMRAGGGTPRRLEWSEARSLVPILAPGYGAGALLDPQAMDIDVHALLQGYLRAFRSAGGALVADAEVIGLERVGGVWHARTREAIFAAPVLINAAGAWADAIAGLAGLPPLGIAPLRRSMVTIDAPPGIDFVAWPMFNDVEEQFYVKPDAGRLLLSPAEETPSPACDAQPEDLDLALAVDRLERATTLKVTRLLGRWAGLRCFAPDRTPVVGFDPLAEGFFWLAGQGGYGIQTSPALGSLTAALVRGRSVPAEVTAEGVAEAELAPCRFR